MKAGTGTSVGTRIGHISIAITLENSTKLHHICMTVKRFFFGNYFKFIHCKWSEILVACLSDLTQLLLSLTFHTYVPKGKFSVTFDTIFQVA